MDNLQLLSLYRIPVHSSPHIFIIYNTHIQTPPPPNSLMVSEPFQNKAEAPWCGIQGPLWSTLSFHSGLFSCHTSFSMPYKLLIPAKRVFWCKFLPLKILFSQKHFPILFHPVNFYLRSQSTFFGNLFWLSLPFSPTEWIRSPSSIPHRTLCPPFTVPAFSLAFPIGLCLEDKPNILAVSPSVWQSDDTQCLSAGRTKEIRTSFVRYDNQLSLASVQKLSCSWNF